MKLRTKLLASVAISFLLSIFIFLIVYQFVLIYYIIPNRFSSVFEYNLVTMLSFIIAIIVFVVSFFTITHRRIKYIKYIETRVRKIAHDNLGLKVNIIGKDELADLATTINTMSERLRQSVERERKEEKLKTEFIANLSHDLRSPLTTIKGFLGIIREKRYQNKQQLEEYIETAYHKAEQLQQRLDDLFTYTKWSNQAVELKREKINLVHMLAQFTDEMSPVATEHDITVTTDFPKQAIEIWVDPAQLLRVFENLFYNALQHSKKPSPLHITLEEQRNQAKISFQNRCHPISSEDLPYLFERLYRLDKARSPDDARTGLGLAIAKEIVFAHHGDIWAESDGEQICFSILLPLTQQDDQ